MAARALDLHPAVAPVRPSVTHRLTLGLVWVAIASGAMVFAEPAPVDVVTLGLVVLLPLVGLVAVTPALLVLLTAMTAAAAAAIVSAMTALELGLAMTHTGVTIYLYMAAFVLAAFVARRPDAHARLMLNAYTWAAAAAALAGIVGYFDLVPGAYDTLTRYGRATGFFKDPNVFGPFLVPGLIYALARLMERPARRSLPALAVILLLGFAVLLSFSRGAWLNLALALAVYGALAVLTTRTSRARLQLLGLLCATVLAGTALIGMALQLDDVADLAAERVSLEQSYDEGPDGRFGGQEKAAALILANPLGIGAQQFVPQHHHEEPHNVYLAMFLNAGWLGGLIFLGLVLATLWHGARHALVRCASQPLFLVAYASFAGNAVEGLVIDLDHWRHFYVLLALVWGMMLSPRRAQPA